MSLYKSSSDLFHVAVVSCIKASAETLPEPSGASEAPLWAPVFKESCGFVPCLSRTFDPQNSCALPTSSTLRPSQRLIEGWGGGIRTCSPNSYTVKPPTGESHQYEGKISWYVWNEALQVCAFQFPQTRQWKDIRNLRRVIYEL